MAAAEDPSAEALETAQRGNSRSPCARKAWRQSASAGEPANALRGLPNAVRLAFPGPAHRLRPLRTIGTLQRRAPKMENHAHAMALHFLYYNFVRIHKTLKTTPAMAAGVTNRLWGSGGYGESARGVGGVKWTPVLGPAVKV